MSGLWGGTSTRVWANDGVANAAVTAKAVISVLVIMGFSFVGPPTNGFLDPA
jgi:hypothetical protein